MFSIKAILCSIVTIIILCHEVFSNDKYYAMFFLDNSLDGSASLRKQVSIINEYILQTPNSQDSVSITILSQGKTSFNTSFLPLTYDDYGTFYKCLASVLLQQPATGNISYLELTTNVAVKSPLGDDGIYTKNPLIVYFVDSWLNRIEDTRKLLSLMEYSYSTDVKIISIIFDNLKTSAATFLTKNKDFVHLSTNPQETTEWVYNQY